MKELRNRDGLTLEEFLAAYDVTKYQRPSVTADMAVFTMLESEGILDLSVLLVRRGDHPALGKYALPGGFVNIKEELQEAAARELQEETGVSGLCFRQFGVFGAVDRDPRTRVITVGHYAVAPMGSLNPLAGDDAAEASLFALEAHKEAVSASAETYRVTLYGSRILVARAQLRYDPLGAVTAPFPLDPGDLASDHSHVLFAALCALNAQPRERIARLFTLGAPEREAEAIEALDRALACIPREL